MAQLAVNMHFSPVDGSEKVHSHVIVDSREQAYSKARDALIEQGHATDIQQFEQKFDKAETHFRFADPPWETPDEIVDELRTLDGVSYVRYEDSYEGFYEPPKWHVGISTEGDADDVETRILEYFDGFEIERQSERYIIARFPGLSE